MTVEELLDECDLFIATKDRFAQCASFSCDNEDLDDFFAKDSIVYDQRLLGKTYVFCHKTTNAVVCAFTLSNDSIRITNKLNIESKEQFLGNSELSEKNLRRYPAVLIGRLGTNRMFAGKGYGSAVMDFIKTWFRVGNKTGCRFIIVDAYNSIVRYISDIRRIANNNKFMPSSAYCYIYQTFSSFSCIKFAYSRLLSIIKVFTIHHIKYYYIAF